jgi:hypothetical protein
MMRSLAILVASIACSSALVVRPTAAQTPPATCLVTPGRSIGVMTLGMNRDTVTRLWGRPDSTETDEEGTQWMTFELLRVGLIALSPEGTVTVIGIGDDRCMRTVEGLATGDTRTRVRAVYGEPANTSEDRLSDIVVKKKARLWIGSAVRDLYTDAYPTRGLTILTGQTMHVNGYTRDGTPILVPVDPEPLVDAFVVTAPRRQSALALGR